MLSSMLRTRSAARLFVRGGGGHHYKGYNEPGGRLFDIPAAPPGYRRKKLWFENMYYYGFGGTFFVFLVFMYYRPEPEIQAWARQEALLRMKERGDTWMSTPTAESQTSVSATPPSSTQH